MSGIKGLLVPVYFFKFFFCKVGVLFPEFHHLPSKIKYQRSSYNIAHNMKALIFSCFALFICCSNTTIAQNCTETLPIGTLVFLENAELVSYDQATIGKNVRFTVRMDVVANGVQLVRTGAIAMGRVKNTTAPTYNDPATITLEVTHVQTIDGQMVALNSNEQTYKGLFPRESMVVHPGQGITATTMNNSPIRVKK